jgi:hypothetical protein
MATKSGTKQGAHNEKPAAPKQVAHPPQTAGVAPLLAGKVMELAEYANTRPQRQAQLLQMQKQQGNRFVQRRLADLQRTEGEEEAAAAPKVINASGVSINEKLPGYGLTPLIQRAPAKEKVKAHVGLTSNSPGMVALPAAAIGASHGRPDAVGWTTPQFNVKVTYADEQNVHVKVILDFMVELPIDYDSAAAEVVIDHELGHVRIGERKAQKHLVDEVKAEFEKLDKVEDASQIQSVLAAGAQKFKDAEKEASNSYDNTDYARMVEAYQGVRKTLSELASKSAAIAQVAGALRGVNSRLLMNLRNHDFGTIEALADAAITARGALSAQELARLQYNKEFKALVGSCKGKIEATRRFDLMIGVDPENIPDDLKAKLTALEAALGGFSFSPSGATAGY